MKQEHEWIKVRRDVYNRLLDLVVCYAREDVERKMHFVEADIAYGSAYLTVNNDKVYRVWIGDRGEPLMELLTPLQMVEWEGHKRHAHS